MIERLWERLQLPLGSEETRRTSADLCPSCGETTLPGSVRCIDCLEN